MVPAVQTDVGQQKKDTFFCVYTCGRCETRNGVTVNRVAWESGVVIGKCFGCDAQHLLADAKGKCDELNTTQFSNAYYQSIHQGVPTKTLRSYDPVELKKAGLKVLPDGNISLIPREGEVAHDVDESTGRVRAVQSRIRDRIEQQRRDEEKALARQEQDEQDEFCQKFKPRSYEDEAIDPPSVTLPEGIAPGGDLTIKIPGLGAARLVHVNIPEGARPGDILRVDGLIEVRAPPDVVDGDVLALKLPSGDDVRVVLQGRDLDPQAIINIGFPLTLLENNHEQQLPPPEE